MMVVAELRATDGGRSTLNAGGVDVMTTGNLLG